MGMPFTQLKVRPKSGVSFQGRTNGLLKFPWIFCHSKVCSGRFYRAFVGIAGGFGVMSITTTLSIFALGFPVGLAYLQDARACKILVQLVDERSSGQAALHIRWLESAHRFTCLHVFCIHRIYLYKYYIFIICILIYVHIDIISLYTVYIYILCIHIWI